MSKSHPFAPLVPRRKDVVLQPSTLHFAPRDQISVHDVERTSSSSQAICILLREIRFPYVHARLPLGFTLTSLLARFAIKFWLSVKLTNLGH